MTITKEDMVYDIKERRTASHLSTEDLLDLFQNLKKNEENDYVIDRVTLELLLRKQIS